MKVFKNQNHNNKNKLIFKNLKSYTSVFEEEEYYILNVP
jgi:hypothetical protein